jgi:hypothetical protein
VLRRGLFAFASQNSELRSHPQCLATPGMVVWG